MGYMSNGKLWIDKKVIIPEEVQNELNEFDEYNEETNVYSFEYWKWYSSYDEVKIIEDFLKELDEELWDFAVVGEDGAVVFEPHYVKFSTYTMIEEL